TEKQEPQKPPGPSRRSWPFNPLRRGRFRCRGGLRWRRPLGARFPARLTHERGAPLHPNSTRLAGKPNADPTPRPPEIPGGGCREGEAEFSLLPSRKEGRSPRPHNIISKTTCM